MFRKSVVLSLLCIGVFAFLSPVFSDLQENVRVDLIEIWVKVTDKDNHPVRGLGPDDFQIYIDNKRMETRCFDQTFGNSTDVSSSIPIQESSAVRSPKRRFIFFFDMLNSSSSDMNYLKGKITDFLQTSFTDNDEGMVFVLLPNVHLGVVQQMTSSREDLINVVNKMGGNPNMEIRIRNNEKQLLDLLYGFAVPNRGGNTSIAVQPDLVRQARAVAQGFAKQEENLSRYTLNSFGSIASYLQMDHLDGRLVMVYVSGGFPLHPGNNYFQIIDRALEDSNEFGSNELGFREHPDYDFDKEVRNMVGHLNRLNVTIYSVDCSGMAEHNNQPDRTTQQLRYGSDTVAYQKELQDSLVMVSEETGGLVFTNSQNFEKGLAQIATDLGDEYWLCSSVPQGEKAGSYHKIEVKMARSDLKVRHRKGYVE